MTIFILYFLSLNFVFAERADTIETLRVLTVVETADTVVRPRCNPSVIRLTRRSFSGLRCRITRELIHGVQSANMEYESDEKCYKQCLWDRDRRQGFYTLVERSLESGSYQDPASRSTQHFRNARRFEGELCKACVSYRIDWIRNHPSPEVTPACVLFADNGVFFTELNNRGECALRCPETEYSCSTSPLPTDVETPSAH